MNTSLTSLLPSQQMLSSDISAITNIRLDSVKRTIERLAERRVITLPPTVEKPTAGRTSTEYVFSGEQGKLDSITVVAQLCPEFTAAIVKRWYELEKRTPAFDINNPLHLLNAIEVQAKQNLQLTSENKVLTKAIETIKPDDQYDAGDLYDAYSLAYENTSWLETMFYEAKDEVEIIKEAIKQNTHGAVFATLERLIHIAAYLAETHSNTFDIEREKYEAEWEATKNG